MPAKKWSDTSYVDIAPLFDEPQRFDLLQAVRLLHRQAQIGNVPIEIRFRSSLSLAYPLAEIESMTLVPQESMDNCVRQVEIYPAHIGLTGPMSALPAFYTNQLAMRVRHIKDGAAPEFLDLFNHRLTSLYVKASWFYNLPIQYELDDNQDKYLLSLRALARQPTSLTSIDSLIAYAGRISPGRLSADQLAHVLSHFLKIKISVEQFIPEWFDLPATEQTALGTQHMQLGVSAFCGARVIQFDSKIKIIFHQLNAERYIRLLPQGDIHQVITEFIRKWCGVCLAVDVQLELDKKEVKPLSLSESEFGGLGRGGFLVSQPAYTDFKDTYYALPVQ